MAKNEQEPNANSGLVVMFFVVILSFLIATVAILMNDANMATMQHHAIRHQIEHTIR